MSGSSGKVPKVRLRCVLCGTRRAVKDQPVAGQDVRTWFAARGFRCTECIEDPSRPARLAAEARDRGMAAALMHSDGVWKASAEGQIYRLSTTGRRLQADDVTRVVGLPPNESTGVMGALFRSAASAGLIRKIGHVESQRSPRHGSTQGVWIGAWVVTESETTQRKA